MVPIHALHPHCPRHAPVPQRPHLPPDRACEVARAIAATILCVDPADIASARRETAPVARARHIAMYLAHTTLSLSLAQTAAGFGRDRTSVAYAMRRIEDARDEPDFDAQLGRMEHLARMFQDAANEVPR